MAHASSPGPPKSSAKIASKTPGAPSPGERTDDADWEGVADVLGQDVQGSIDATRMPGEAYQSRLIAQGTPLREVGYQSRLATAEEEASPERYAVGDVIGNRYEVLAIHCGTMGVVFGTFDRETNLPRALKTLQNRFATSSMMGNLFKEEAATWVMLEKHPFIVRAHLVERFDNQPYVVTEYIRGQEGMAGDLRGWLGHPRLTLAVATEMALQIAQGMQHAVRKVPGLVHRDLKPANILVDDRARAMVTDFGLVHAAQAEAGTPAYMSPEQWRGEPLDQRTDLYSFGCMVYEMLTGRRLFAATSLDDWRAAHLSLVPAPPLDVMPALPAVLDDLVRRCLAKDVSARPTGWDAVVTGCARAVYEVTGQPPVLDFSAYQLATDELLHAALSLLRLGKYQEMLDACDRAIVIEPGQANVWFSKGVALHELKRYDDAIGCYGRATDIDPRHTNVWLSKACTFESLKRYDEAIGCYDRVLAIDSRHARAWNNKGIALERLKRTEEAVACYGRALEIDPADGTVWNRKANALEQLQRYQEACACYERGIETCPRNHAAWFEKGVALEEIGRYEEAIFCYDRAIKSDPHDSSSWASKGEALRRLKRYDEAFTCYDRAVELDPADCNCVLYSKGDALAELGRYDEAVEVYDRELEIYPDFSRVLLNKGKALNSLRRHAEAIGCYDRGLQGDPGGRWVVDLRGAREMAMKAQRVDL